MLIVVDAVCVLSHYCWLTIAIHRHQICSCVHFIKRFLIYIENHASGKFWRLKYKSSNEAKVKNTLKKAKKKQQHPDAEVHTWNDYGMISNEIVNICVANYESFGKFVRLLDFSINLSTLAFILLWMKFTVISLINRVDGIVRWNLYTDHQHFKHWQILANETDFNAHIFI